MSASTEQPGANGKSYFFLRRRRGISYGEFSAHWSTNHAKLVREHEHYLRYVQSHRVEIDDVPGLTSPHDGVAEFWYPPNRAQTDKTGYLTYSAPDERNFLDHGSETFEVTTTEDPLLDAGFATQDRGLKLIQGFRRPGGVELGAFQAEILTSGQIEIATRLNATRMTVGRTLPDNYGRPYVPYNGTVHAFQTDDPYDAVRAVWWSTREALLDAIERDPATWDALLLGPNAKSPGRSIAMLVEERVIHAKPSPEQARA